MTVNIPEFTLRVVEEGTPIHTARVVVGKPDKQTPVFSDEMEEVVFNPYWNVPNSIKMEEIAPYFSPGGGFFGGGWDTSVLRRHGLRIKYGNRDIDPDQIDWSRNDLAQFRSGSAAGTRQRARPGEVPVPELARRLHARHHAEIPVQQRRARREPRLHAGAEPRPAGRTRARP